MAALSAPERRPALKGRTTEVGGLRIFYQERGDAAGPALVLLPGGMLDSSVLTWKPLLHALPARCRIVSPDLPGYGRSAAPDIAYTTPFYVDFVEGFLDALGIERAVLFGSSMSAAVALHFALRAPQRVQRLVLSGAYGFMRRVPWHAAAYAFSRIPHVEAPIRGLLRAHPLFVRLALPVAVHGRSAVTRELVDDAAEGLRAPHALRAFARWLRWEIGPRCVRSHVVDRLPEIETPTLLLHGAHDWMMPVRHTRAAYQQMLRAELRVFAGSGHLVPREAPTAACQLVMTFLRQGHLGEGEGKR